MVLHLCVGNKRLLACICYEKRDSMSHLLLMSLVVIRGHWEVKNVSSLPFFVMNSVLAFIFYAKRQGWGAGAGRIRVFLAPWSWSRSRLKKKTRSRSAGAGAAWKKKVRSRNR